MRAFATGSQVFGKPVDDSDYDLVIRCDEETRRFLVGAMRLDHGSIAGRRRRIFRFGRLNLITCQTDEEFAAWRTCTEVCKRRSPVLKAAAARLFKRWFRIMGVPDDYVSELVGGT